MESKKTSSKEIFYSLTLESLKDNFISDFTTTPKQPSNLTKTFSDKAINTKNLVSPQRENLPYAKFALTISNILFSFSAASIKLLNDYRTNYNYNLFSAIRYFVIFLLSYQLLVHKRKPIGSLFDIKNWNWFIVRLLSNYLAVFYLTLSLVYIRLSTATCLYMVFPIFNFIFAVIFLKKKSEMKYLYGCILCFLGCICFSFSERTYERNVGNKIENSENSNNSSSYMGFGVLLGIFFGLLNGVNSSLICISAKFLLEEMDSFRANLLIAFYLGAFSFICSLFNMETFIFDVCDFKFIWFGIVNGVIVFAAYHFFFEAIEYADLSKTAYINYIEGILSILYGLLIFGESVTFFDGIGFLLIILPNIYFTFYN